MKSFNINSLIDPEILTQGKEIRLKKDQVLTQQFARANEFYLLKSGTVTFSLSLDDSRGEIEVGQTNEKGAPIGWSGFNPPGRYATTVKVASNTATFIKWSHDQLRELFNSDPEAGTVFLKEVCANARNLIKGAITKLSEVGPSLPITESLKPEEYTLTQQSPDENLVKFLRKSSFFEVFEEAPLEFISQALERRIYGANDTIYEQGGDPDGLYILGTGKVRFSYFDDKEESISFRQINTPGFVVGWGGVIGLPNMINAHAVRESVVYYVSKESLSRILKLNPKFAPVFFRRLLWLISHQLQAIRARIIASQFNHEITAISNLIDQNSAKLELWSPLHKIPHLLEDKLTVGDALNTLEHLKSKGSALEKNIANTAWELLEEIRKEHTFYNGLVNVYNSVVKAPGDLPPEEIRKINALEYQKLFESQGYLIKGEENLPVEPGNIFIYNHLRNHPYNTLPNQFQITLDSHFISAMILMRKYGDPGLRIVRIGLSKEYAHQEYYQRLGHIDVFTEESGKKNSKQKKQVRQMFFNEAGAHLTRGGNLIISPEGNSYSTEETPGPFKPGAFKLAMSMKKEPWIVPIAVANFDRRVRNNRFACIILPPFKASDYIRNAEDKAEMKAFLKDYQSKYRDYVADAIKASKNPNGGWN
ncbi:cyclic nucleotide-binding domain-containing protein [Marinoscillum sp.]|uniref:cyclic nucleotide-binding domain-containing protein n=1 Tax=Marinoscillum sp. TaxID=2024838 RepID=UPI003BAB99C3